jgi:putative ubiquitin-RnfH superfamily antitoxin RatB of RatAB toxin-antitoxin module
MRNRQQSVFSFALLGALAMQDAKSFPDQHDTRADRVYIKPPLTAKQKAARAANKRAKQSRKKKRKS